MSTLSGSWRRSRTSAAPAQGEILRHDAILFLCVLLLLAAGWGVRLLAQSEATRTVQLGPALPAIAYPAAWVATVNPTSEANVLTEGGGALILQARNAGAPSTFNSTLRVEALPVLPDDSLGALRIRQGLRRAQELDRYRELAAEPVAVLRGDGEAGREALLTTYAFLADPTHDSGGNGLPVVVEAQDLLLRAGNQWLVVTVAADASDWAAASADFAPVFESLQLEQMAQ